MAFICGFFNSINGDRKYNAEQMNNPYHRVVSNGVFASANGTSTDLQVQAVSGMNIKVKTGEGIFADKWAKLDGDMPFVVPTAHVTNPRIDSIVVHIDNSEDVRAGSIIYKQGTSATNPVPPELENTGYIHEFRLANIRVNANTGAITQANITDTRPTSECGFVSNLLQNSDVTALFAQWTAQFNEWNDGKHTEFENWEAENKSDFEEWFETVRETLSTATLIRSYTSSYTTATQGETEIPIQITQFNYALDILQVFANGLRLIPDIDYTIDSNEQITLTKDLDINQQVSFVVYKSVDGSEAETVVQQVYELQVKLDATMITDPLGGIKYNLVAGQDMLDKFMSFGMGFHTMYAPSGVLNSPKTGVFRCFGQMTNVNNGWIFAMGVDGSVFTNYVYGGAWRGWKTIYEKTPAALYYSENGVFPNANFTITPSKPLSECQHGWQLVFNLYSNTTSLNNNIQTFLIPKKSNNNADWSNENIIIPLMFQTNDGFEMTQKLFSVTNESLVSSPYNSAGSARNIVLRAVYEY